MRLILITILLISNAYSATQKKALYTYNYSDEPIKFNSNQFIKYIHPQLESIVEGFYEIVRDSHPEQKHILIFRERIIAQSQAITTLYQKCFNVSFDCERKDWRDMHDMLLQFSKEVHTFTIDTQSISNQDEIFIDQLVTFQSKLRTDVGHYLKKFEDQMINGNFTDTLLSDFVLIQSFTKTNLDMIMTGTVDRANYRLFYGLWKNFIAPIEQGLKNKTTAEQLKKELVELNIQWNGFHHQVDRNHFSVKNKNINRIIKNIHRRWTNILKVIVG